MRPFKFNLEQVLELRSFEERQKELELAKITGECVAIKREIDADRKRIDTLFQGKQRITAKDDLFHYYSDRESYYTYLTQQCAKNKWKLAEKEQERLEAQQEYIEASKKRKVLDKLKEKRGLEYKREEQKREASELDDIGLNTYMQSRFK